MRLSSTRRTEARRVLDTQHILELNRTFHDTVECLQYDERMGVDFRPDEVEKMVGELERVLGAPLPSGGTVLDVGAGTGHVAIKLALDGRFERVLAVDISSGMLERARASGDRVGVDIETFVSDMERLPFEDDSVDLVVGCAILHHLPDVRAFMLEVARVLRPGAPCVFIGEPTLWGSRFVDVAKIPVKVAAAARRRGAKPTWEHDNIDVHEFERRDIVFATQGAFDELNVVAEGFIEPLVSQAFLSPFALIAGKSSWTPGLRKRLEWMDQHLFNPLIPSPLRASVKFSAVSAACR